MHDQHMPATVIEPSRESRIYESFDPASGVRQVTRVGEHPLHVACIMDGNGRWATRRGLDRIQGHAAGEASILAAVDAALEEALGWLTLFAFSTENWNRPEAEVSFLMAFNAYVIGRHGADFHARNIRIRYLGQRHRVPAEVLKAMDNIELLTSANTGLNLTFAFNHGGRSEIVDAVRMIVTSGVDPSVIDEDLVSSSLQFPDIPDPDLIIRTSGEFRLSNFMLWRAAYTELVFLDVLWPDFRGQHLREALDELSTRDRRYGAIESTMVLTTDEPPVLIAAGVHHA